MNCIRCGREIADNAMFCDNCEKTVSEPLQESPYLNTQIILPVRKAQQPRPAQPKAARKPEEEKPRGRGKLVLLAALCLLLVAGLLFVGTLYLGGRSDIAQLEEETASLQERNDRLAGNVYDLEKEIATLQEQNEAMESDAAALATQVAALGKDNAKLQQALDFINERVAFVTNDNSGIYHTGDCTHYDRENFVVYDMAMALARGCEPCPYCHPDE